MCQWAAVPPKTSKFSRPVLASSKSRYLPKHNPGTGQERDALRALSSFASYGLAPRMGTVWAGDAKPGVRDLVRDGLFWPTATGGLLQGRAL